MPLSECRQGAGSTWEVVGTPSPYMFSSNLFQLSALGGGGDTSTLHAVIKNFELMDGGNQRPSSEYWGHLNIHLIELFALKGGGDLKTFHASGAFTAVVGNGPPGETFTI